MELGMWPAFFLGVAFTGLLLVAGLGIGLYVGRRRGRMDVEGSVDLRGVAAMMDGLADWTTDVMEDVTHYNALVDSATLWLAESDEADGKKLAQAVKLLSQIARTNDLLKERLAEAERRLHEQTGELQAFMSEARTDSLTGLSNRRAFQDELARRESEWKRHQIAFSVLMLDVDYFKRINDSHGHAAGDEVLAVVSHRLKEALRVSDLVARIGGEEFAVLLAFAEIDTALQTAERVRRMIGEESVAVGGREIRVTISGGVAQIREFESGKQLLARADEALYAAKAAGRDTVWWHDGTTTHPFAEARMAASSSAPHESRVDSSSDPFFAACADLRRQLFEMADAVTNDSSHATETRTTGPS